VKILQKVLGGLLFLTHAVLCSWKWVYPYYEY